MTYNKDIAHCSGYLCPLAENCKRYWLFLKWERFNDDIIVNIIPSCYKEETNSCEFYLKEEE